MVLNFKKPEGFLNRSRPLNVFGQFGVGVGDIGKRLDFEFGDVIVVNDPDDQVLTKFEGNLYFGFTFKGATINKAVWLTSGGGTGTQTQTNNLLVLTSPANNDFSHAKHLHETIHIDAGDMLFEAKVKRDAIGGNSICNVGFGRDRAFGNDSASFELNTDENTWRPEVSRNGTTTTGADFTIPNDTWVKFKIILRLNATEFYANDVLQETLTGANVPDDQRMEMTFRVENNNSATTLYVEWCKIEAGI